MFRISICFLLLISCKNEPRTKKKVQTETQQEAEVERDAESGIDTSVYKMWNDFVKSNPKFKEEKIPEADFFHNNKEDANRLAALTINGNKSAYSGLLRLYQEYNIDLPKVGAKQIITDFKGEAKAIIKNVSVDTIPFNQVSKEHAAMDMGTDIEPLMNWKIAHWDFFESFLAKIGEKPSEEMLVICVRFETIWTE